jgi:hypothetical protein
MMDGASNRLFQRVSLLWLLGFLLMALPGSERLWLDPVSPAWFPPGPLRYFTHALSGDVPEPLVVLSLAVLLILTAWQLFAHPRWWAWLLIWLLYVNLMNRAWMAGSGGQQLMANALFWACFLTLRSERARFIGLWAIRLQVLLAYWATGLHKLTGTHWLDGTALGIVATDHAFGPAWIASFPLFAKGLTWLILFFQLGFPIAVWFSSARTAWLIAGIAFHLATAFWMDIPEMGLAFIACYALWLDDEHAARLLRFATLSKRGSTLA